MGAILAGGRARRFGGDKAAALVAGMPLMERVIAALAPQVDAVVVVGRGWPGLASVPDRPMAGMGPLGGLAGALHHARDLGFDAVLTSGCDLPDVPPDLIAHLSPGPAVVRGQPLMGLWPVALSDDLFSHLAGGGELAMRSWIERTGARRVDLGYDIPNINTPADLADYLTSTADRRSSR